MFTQVKFRPHTEHNPSCDIVEGHLGADAFITYGEYTLEPSRKFVEYYSGENYKPESGKKSYSRHWPIDSSLTFSELPASLRDAAKELHQIYLQKFKS
jgi:hypothetical protein